jgi:N-acetylneuraminate synthase
MREFRLGDRPVGPDHPPLVIPEVGINHEGSIDKALQMVDAAADAGAEIIKFQCHITEAEMIPTDMKPGEISDERLWDIIKRCELTAEEEVRVQKYCEQKGLIYLSTPFSREAADRLNAMGVVGFKIGSGECNNIPLIAHIARMGKPMIVSTGMNDLPSVARTMKVIQEIGTPVMLMHCTSSYPTPYEAVRLNAIVELQQTFGVPVGLSDHSVGIYTCLGAVALGAAALEKHFTVSRDAGARHARFDRAAGARGAGARLARGLAGARRQQDDSRAGTAGHRFRVCVGRDHSPRARGRTAEP